MRFSGKVGFEKTMETDPGVWEPVITTRTYFGDVNRYTHRWNEKQNSINDDFNISNEVSIVSDHFLLENLGIMKFVEFGGSRWKISTINVQYPRVILTLGGLYNEEIQDV